MAIDRVFQEKRLCRCVFILVVLVIGMSTSSGFFQIVEFIQSFTSVKLIASKVIFLIVNVLFSISAALILYFTLPPLLQFTYHIEGFSGTAPAQLEIYGKEIIEFLHESVVILSSDFFILRGNAISSDFFGGIVPGRPLLDIIHPDDSEEFRNSVQRVLTSYSQQPITIEYRVYSAEAKDLIWVESTLCAPTSAGLVMSESTEKVIHMITRSISENKLSQIIQEKEKEWATQEVLNAAKMSYISCIAHDLKTPLHAFGFVIDLLKPTLTTVEQVDYLDQAKIAMDLMRVTISQTMDISKLLSDGELEPHKATVLLSSLLERIKVIM